MKISVINYYHIMAHICSAIFNIHGVESFAKRIPIGTLYDNPKPPQHATSILSYDMIQDLVTSSRLVVQQAQSALRFEIEKFNNKSEKMAMFFNIDQYEKVVDTSDSFEVTKAICSTMPKGIFLLYGVADPQTLDVTESFGKTFHLPYISHDQPPLTFSSPSNFSIFMTPTQHNTLIDVMAYYNWNKAIYIYDSEQGLQRFQQIYSELHKRRMHDVIKIEGIRLKDSCDSYSLLRHIDQNYPDFRKNFVLDFSSNAVLTHILHQIKHVGMHRTGYHYLIAGTRISEIDLKEFRYGGVNFTGFRLVNPDHLEAKKFQKNWSKLGHTWPGSDYPIKLEAWITLDAVSVIISALKSLLDKSPNSFKQIFMKNSNIGEGKCRFDQSQPWPLGLEVTKSIKQVQQEGFTGPISFNEQGHRINFRYEVLEMTFNSHIKQIGAWNDSYGLTLNESETKASTLSASNHTKVIVSSIISAPYLMIRKQRGDGPLYSGNEIYEGFCKELADKIADIVGFKYILKLVSDNKYGTLMENGSWNGMVGELEREVADLAIAPLTISSIRERAIDFSKPFMTLGISVMIRKPEKQKPGVLSFTDPLHYRIWLCVVFAYLGVSFVLFAVNSVSPQTLYAFDYEKKDSQETDESNDFSLANSLWFSLSAFMQQGCTLSPRSVSGRVAGSSWWFFTLILISTYTANLAAFLTIERMLTPIQSASDLPKQNQISYGTLDAGSTKDFFRMSKVEAYEAMWEYMEANKNVYVKTTDEGVERVKSSKGKYAFLLESTMNDYYNQKKPCDTMKVGPDLDSKGYGVATRVGHNLKEPVGLAVLQLRESGELTKLHKKWWFDKGECSPDGDKASGSAQRALTLSHVAGIFYILVSGLLFSLIVCFFEFLYKQNKKTPGKFGVPISSIFGIERSQHDSSLISSNAVQYWYIQPTYNGSNQPLSQENELKWRCFSSFDVPYSSQMSLKKIKNGHNFPKYIQSAPVINVDQQLFQIPTR